MSYSLTHTFLALALGACFAGSAAAQSQAAVGSAYILSNSASGNAVLAFDRAPNGVLTPAGSFATGGQGNGGGLGSQNALVLSSDGQRLFGVDAGSNEINVFDVVPGGLLQRAHVNSGGTMPTSIAVRGDVLYVLNAGGNGNLVGFYLATSGALTMIPNSTRPLSGNATSPAQIEFAPNGDSLFVTERATNLIDTFEIDHALLMNFRTFPSNGMTPFGFAFGKHQTLIVAEAFGGAPDASALSSYKVDGPDSLTVAAPSVPTTETAACWVAVTKNGRFAYTTNTGSGSVTGYRVGTNGSLARLDANGVTGSTGAGSTPIDVELSRDSHFLYALARDAGSLVAFRVGGDGDLTLIPSVVGLPTTAAGLAVR
ncbi:MAG: 3-carboxymuconate cyclase [Planctomycetota bacterium]